MDYLSIIKQSYKTTMFSIQQTPSVYCIWISIVDQMDCETIDIYVCGDGGIWSCTPSVLYRIPTEIFDYQMMIGGLDCQEDLDLLVENIAKDEKRFGDDEYTDIYVQNSGSWSGVASVRFSIPADVFNHIQLKPDVDKILGRLHNNFDLEKLIEKSRYEIINGVSDAVVELVRSRPLNVEEKKCGHVCTRSSVKDGCCGCMDRRPINESGVYPMYIDGQGWTNMASRGAGYCPQCSY